MSAFRVLRVQSVEHGGTKEHKDLMPNVVVMGDLFNRNVVCGCVRWGVHMLVI